MPIPFSRSTRAITNDIFRPSLIGLAIAILLLIAWAAWLVSAKVAVYETTSDLQLLRDNFVVAKFTPDEFARIRLGQPATATSSETNATFRAQVMEVANRSSNRMEPNTVRLYVYSNPPLKQAPSEVRIQVAELSPLAFILQSSAQTTEKVTSAK